MRSIARAVAAAATVCAIGTGVAGCGGDAGPKVSGTPDPPTTVAAAGTTSSSSSSAPPSHLAAAARARELASIAKELAALRQELADSTTLIDGTDVDAAKREEGTAP
jgi:hypothetical protein